MPANQSQFGFPQLPCCHGVSTSIKPKRFSTEGRTLLGGVLQVFPVIIGGILLFCTANFGNGETLQPPSAFVSHDAGPFVAEFALTLEEGHRTEAFGPLFYRRQTPDEVTFAIPPLFSRLSSPSTDSEEIDFGYPILTYERFGQEYRWQLFQLLSFSGGADQSATNAHKFTLFPFYFQQRSLDPKQNYTALFPLVGRLQGRIFRSEIEFALWPLYLKTTRHGAASDLPDDPFTAPAYRFLSARRGETTTYNFVYPIFHLRYGEGLHGWQLWPLIGHEEKVVTQQTNSWGDVVTIPGHRRDFLLWPIWYDQHRNIGSDNPERVQGFVPFYHFLRSSGRDSTSYLWPFGPTITDDRTRKYREVDAPWPFIVFARGEGKTADRVWPFYSRVSNTNLTSKFVLWPLYKQNLLHSAPLERSRTRILFFLYSDTVEKNSDTGKSKSRQDFWPLFTSRREFDGRTRLQVLSLLEPLLPQSKSIERNYSPVWSLWRSEHNPVSQASSQSFLWNLYRRETRLDAKKCSLLFGLFQYESQPDAARMRILGIPIDRSAKTSAGVPVSR